MQATEQREWTIYVCPACGSVAVDAMGENPEWCFGFGSHEARREPVVVVAKSDERDAE